MIMAFFLKIELVDLIGIIVAVVTISFVYMQWIFRYWKRRNIPYFEPTIPAGNIPSLLNSLSIGQVIFTNTKNAKEKGWKYYGLYLTTSPFLVLLDLDMVKHVLVKDYAKFNDRGLYVNEDHDPLSANLFTLAGVKWKNLRTKLTPTFTSGKLRGMFQTVVNSSLLLEEHLKRCNVKEPIDIKNYLACFTMDVIGSCAFGLECNSFNQSNSQFVKFGMKILNRSALKQFLPFIANSFPTLAKAFRYKPTPTDVSKFFSDIVTETINYREKNNISRKDFLQILIDNKRTNEDGNKGDDDGALSTNEIIAQSFIFFLAGFETSSTTMTFALYELSTHPEIQEKVREEVFRVLKKYDNKICYDALKELEYMQQVIEETLRKYPALPFLSRKCNTDYKLPGTDIMIEKGTNVIIPIQNIHYFDDIYKNPYEFNPDRFSPENKNDRNPYAHIPFGEGPRICIGMRFGVMQTKAGLATVLRNFRVKLNAKTKVPLEMDPRSITLSVKGGMWLNLESL